MCNIFKTYVLIGIVIAVPCLGASHQVAFEEVAAAEDLGVAQPAQGVAQGGNGGEAVQTTNSSGTTNADEIYNSCAVSCAALMGNQVQVHFNGPRPDGAWGLDLTVMRGGVRVGYNAAGGIGSQIVITTNGGAAVPFNRCLNGCRDCMRRYSSQLRYEPPRLGPGGGYYYQEIATPTYTPDAQGAGRCTMEYEHQR